MGARFARQFRCNIAECFVLKLSNGAHTAIDVGGGVWHRIQFHACLLPTLMISLARGLAMVHGVLELAAGTRLARAGGGGVVAGNLLTGVALRLTRARRRVDGAGKGAGCVAITAHPVGRRRGRDVDKLAGRAVRRQRTDGNVDARAVTGVGHAVIADAVGRCCHIGQDKRAGQTIRSRGATRRVVVR